MMHNALNSLGLLVAIYKNKDPKKESFILTYIEYAKKIFMQQGQMNKVDEIDEIIVNAKKYPQNVSSTY